MRVRLPKQTWENLAPVEPTAILALLARLTDRGSEDLWALADVLDVVGAAHRLRFVVARQRAISITDLGRHLLSAPLPERQRLFAQRIMRLNLFRDLMARLHRADAHELDEANVLAELRARMPREDLDRVLATFVKWGRYAGLLEEDAARGKIRLP
jgi:hypothetical protein